MGEEDMQAQITQLWERISVIEKTQLTLEDIKQDTTDLLTAFNALRGAWAVLIVIGKIGKPLAVLATFFAAFYTFKGK